MLAAISLMFLPLLYWCLSASTFGLALHLPTQSQRYCYLPIFLTFAILSIKSSRYLSFFPPLISLWNQGMTLCIAHILSVLYIEQVPAPDPPAAQQKSESSKLSTKDTWAWRVRTTYRLWGNPQLLRVERDQLQSEGSSQHLSAFMFLRVIKLPIYYMLHVHILPMIFDETIVDILSSDVGPTQQKFIGRATEITAREATVRGYVAVFWIWESVVFLDGANSILALICVGFGFDQPEDWPTLFGCPSKATSLKRFWNSFWHSVAARPYQNYGRVVAGCLLGLDPMTVISKTVVALVVFGLSGITHAVVIWQAGLEDWHLELQWFLLNFLACFTETFFLAALRATAKKLGWSRFLDEIQQSWLGYLFGYTWVFGFFFWSVPKWRYPRLEQQAIALEKYWAFIARFETMGSQDSNRFSAV